MPFAYFTTACSAKPSPQEELDLQARFLPTVYNIDAGTYAFVSKEAPTPLTKQMYEDALFKLGLLKDMMTKQVQISSLKNYRANKIKYFMFNE